MSTPFDPARTHTGALRLDGAVLRTRRLELGLSERSLTATLGLNFSQTIVRSIEAGQAATELTLNDVQRLGEVLGLDVRSFLLIDVADRTTPSAVAVDEAALEDADGELHTTPCCMAGPLTATGAAALQVEVVRSLGAMLQQAGQGVPAETLAGVLGIHLQDLQDALCVLDQVVAPAGLVTHQVNGLAALRPATTPGVRQLLAARARVQTARNGLDRGQASILAATIRGDRTGNHTNSERVATASLVNAGVLTATPTGVAVSADTAFSLLLDTAPGPCTTPPEGD